MLNSSYVGSSRITLPATDALYSPPENPMEIESLEERTIPIFPDYMAFSNIGILAHSASDGHNFSIKICRIEH